MQLTLQPAKIYGIQLGPSREIERLFDVLYLDDKVRVVEFLPDGSPDSNSTQPVLFVMRRLSEVQHASSSMQVSLCHYLQPKHVNLVFCESMKLWFLLI